MNKYILIYFLFLPFLSQAQFGTYEEKPYSFLAKVSSSEVRTISLQPNKNYIDELKEDDQLFCTGYNIKKKIPFEDFSLVAVTAEGDKVYQLDIFSSDANGMAIEFSDLSLKNGGMLWVINQETKKYVGMYSARDIKDNGTPFRTSPLYGDRLTIEYIEPRDAINSKIEIGGIYHYFRGLKSADGYGDAESCMLNVACSESANYGTSYNATCKIIVYGNGKSYFCSGTLMNNVREDGTPYILTANHCSKNSTLSDLNQWEFQFFYQYTTCNNSLIEPNYVSFLGASAPAYTGSDNGDYSSDFLLCKLNDALPVNTFNFTFMGWDRNSEGTVGGVCFHHPAGDVKKVSTYTSKPIISSYRGKVAGTHYAVQWAPTTNGFSVTEGGSSGSGLVNKYGLLIGTLTGGASSCTNKYEYDYFGRLYYHWDQNGAAASIKLQNWLDPDNTGAMWVRTSQASTLSILPEKKVQNFSVKQVKSGIMVHSKSMNIDAVIYDMQGRIVYQIETKERALFVPHDLMPKGIYILNLTSGDKTYSMKFIN